MSVNRIVVTPKDYPVLRNLAETLPRRSRRRQEHYERFIREIRNAIVTESAQAANGVVTVRSRVTYRYEDSDEVQVARVVFPAEMRGASENVSILSPFGMALIGEREGTVVEYAAPGGSYRVTIDKVEQPMAAVAAAGQL